MLHNEKSQYLKDTILKAIDDHVITKAEYDKIIYLATEDGIIDKQEQVLLGELQDMIEHKFVKIVP